MYIDSPQLHHSLGHGWTILVALELRADSLIALLTLSELKIAVIQKILPWSALEVRDLNDTCLCIILASKPDTCFIDADVLKISWSCKK